MSKEKANQRIDESIARYREGKSPKKYNIILFAFAGFLALGLLLYFTVGEELLSSRGQVVTLENRDEILYGTSADEAEDANYEVVMSSHWTFKDSGAVSEDAYVENSSRNTNSVYFTITRTDTEEIIYISPRVAPGNYVANIKLSAALSAGDYDTILTYYLLDGSNNVISSIPMKLLITIEQ
ncbi:MAG: hypothetical protein IJ833_08050 [Lachnospiraceae bacterium]|nr:hypothetical protein [Lachnospiraceae bacterium]